MSQFLKKCVAFGCMVSLLSMAACEREVELGFPPGNNDDATEGTGGNADAEPSSESDSSSETETSSDAGASGDTDNHAANRQIHEGSEYVAAGATTRNGGLG